MNELGLDLRAFGRPARKQSIPSELSRLLVKVKSHVESERDFIVGREKEHYFVSKFPGSARSSP
jgi:hypothetical protein